MEHRSFSTALQMLKEGKQVYRYGWNGAGMWLSLQKPDENSKMSAPYIYIKSVDNKLCPWTPSQTDLMAEDWLEFVAATPIKG